MRNYIQADLKRIFKRIPHIAVMALLNVILAGVVLNTYRTNWNSVFYLLGGELFLQVMPVVVGLLDLSAVYGDDFRAKTMQVAIGSGLSRTRIVCAKLIEMAVIVFLDLLELTVFFLIIGAVLGAGVNGAQVAELFGSMLMSALATVSFTSLTMILAFFRQGVGLANLLYLVLNVGLVTQLLSLVLGIEAVDRLVGRFHLINLTLYRLLETARSRLMLGTFDVEAFGGVAVYILLGSAITSMMFKKRELEF